MATDFRGAPGVYTGNTLKARNIFTNIAPAQVQYLPSFAFIDGSLSRDVGETPVDVLRAGIILGKITTGGLYRPSIIGVVHTAAVATATSIVVNAAVATEVARLRALAGGNINITLTGVEVAGTAPIVRDVVACSAASGTTLTVAATTHAFAVGSLVQPADGSDIPVTVLPNPYGLDVLDTGGTNLYQPIDQFLRGGDLIAAKVINLVKSDFSDTIDTQVQKWLKQQLNGGGTATRGLFSFDNDLP